MAKIFQKLFLSGWLSEKKDEYIQSVSYFFVKCNLTLNFSVRYGRDLTQPIANRHNSTLAVLTEPSTNDGDLSSTYLEKKDKFQIL